MRASAKLNLALHITGQRADGYHLLHSLVAFADIGDEISVKPAIEDTLRVDGPFADGVPSLEQNSLGAALAAVRGWAEAPDPLHIQLTKNLPIASGIGGGSADAAALIRLLMQGRALTVAQMNDSLALGADVPMCVVGHPALVGCIGEDNTPVTLPEAHVVLVNPGVAVSTPNVFGALDNKNNAPMPDWTAPTSFSDLVGHLQNTRNDLMVPAISIAPDISRCLEVLREAPFARMSGSGATCFALLETASDAERLAAQTQNAHPDWWVRAGKLTMTAL
jgi:4-diphosphocytidyl-2-C-methyl-D-erythritol kinase